MKNLFIISAMLVGLFGCQDKPENVSEPTSAVVEEKKAAQQIEQHMDAAKDSASKSLDHAQDAATD